MSSPKTIIKTVSYELWLLISYYVSAQKEDTKWQILNYTIHNDSVNLEMGCTEAEFDKLVTIVKQNYTDFIENLELS